MLAIKNTTYKFDRILLDISFEPNVKSHKITWIKSVERRISIWKVERKYLAHSDHRLNDMKCGSRLKKSKRFEKLTTFDEIRKSNERNRERDTCVGMSPSVAYGFTLAVYGYIPIYMETQTHICFVLSMR